MIKGGIFDIDGTLLDSMWIWSTIGEDYLRSIGFVPRENLNKTFQSMSLQQAACYYRSEYGVPLSVEEIMAGVNERIFYAYEKLVSLKPGVASFLQKLQSHGVKMCIATATDRHLVEAALARCGVLGYFSEIFTCTSVGHGKDEPVIYRTAMAHLGTDRSNTMVFEDALYALRTAKEDGFSVTGIFDEHEENKSKVRALSDIYISDFTDFPGFWEQVSR